MKQVASTVGEFINCLDEFSVPEIYRGQADRTWPVIPSLARKSDELGKLNLGYTTWSSCEKELLREFKRLAVPFMSFAPDNDIEWLIHAQHHGLPTTILDWTTNALNALFFAVENPEHDSSDGAVFGHTPDAWYEDTEHVRSEHNETICFYSKNINQRIIAQESCFMAFLIPEGIEPFEPLDVRDETDKYSTAWLDEITIPKEAKKNLRRELAKLGKTHYSIFPGIDGIAASIKQRIGWI